MASSLPAIPSFSSTRFRYSAAAVSLPGGFVVSMRNSASKCPVVSPERLAPIDRVRPLIGQASSGKSRRQTHTRQHHSQDVSSLRMDRPRSLRQRFASSFAGRRTHPADMWGYLTPSGKGIGTWVAAKLHAIPLAIRLMPTRRRWPDMPGHERYRQFRQPVSHNHAGCQVSSRLLCLRLHDLLLSSSAALADPQDDKKSDHEPANQAYLREHYTKYEYRIPMRDGMKLFTAVYVPKDESQRYPILLTRTPYSVQPYGVDQYPSRPRPVAAVRQGGVHLRLPGRARPVDVGRRVRQHAAAQRRRRTGRRTSTRAATPSTPSTGWSSTCRTTTARSGMWGISYPGFYTAAGMIDAHPALEGRLAAGAGHRLVHRRRLAPQRRVVPAARASTSWSTFGQPRPEPTKKSSQPFDHDTPDGYEFFLQHGPAGQRRREVLQGRGRLLERGDAARHLRRVLEGPRICGRT